MNLFDAVERFSDQESCIEHLEHVRWGNPQCSHCESDRVAPKREGDKVGRWNIFVSPVSMFYLERFFKAHRYHFRSGLWLSFLWEMQRKVCQVVNLHDI